MASHEAVNATGNGIMETTIPVESPSVTTISEASSSPSQRESILLTLCIVGGVWIVIVVALVVFRYQRKQRKRMEEASHVVGIECGSIDTMVTVHHFPVQSLPLSQRSMTISDPKQHQQHLSLPRLRTNEDEDRIDYHTVTFIGTPGTNSTMLTVTYHESIIQSEPSPPLLEELGPDDDYHSDGEESGAIFYSMSQNGSIDSYMHRSHGFGRSWANSNQSGGSAASSSDGYFTMSSTQLPQLR
ncbi:hypothetical protein THRCLA_01787 [Thraustotheca clavata]|uniref:Uncharacterized protein n=1 Tax=Thraustotheca clavata TaxID=74557 RepID=A0A1W0A7I0_9STRA|nr:hypothetical protein THRCLA_01787 [Thraustotheca clavata]